MSHCQFPCERLLTLASFSRLLLLLLLLPRHRRNADFSICHRCFNFTYHNITDHGVFEKFTVEAMFSPHEIIWWCQKYRIYGTFQNYRLNVRAWSWVYTVSGPSHPLPRRSVVGRITTPFCARRMNGHIARRRRPDEPRPERRGRRRRFRDRRLARRTAVARRIELPRKPDCALCKLNKMGTHQTDLRRRNGYFVSITNETDFLPKHRNWNKVILITECPAEPNIYLSQNCQFWPKWNVVRLKEAILAQKGHFGQNKCFGHNAKTDMKWKLFRPKPNRNGIRLSTNNHGKILLATNWELVRKDLVNCWPCHNTPKWLPTSQIGNLWEKDLGTCLARTHQNRYTPIFWLLLTCWLRIPFLIPVRKSSYLVQSTKASSWIWGQWQ